MSRHECNRNFTNDGNRHSGTGSHHGLDGEVKAQPWLRGEPFEELLTPLNRSATWQPRIIIQSMVRMLVQIIVQTIDPKCSKAAPNTEDHGKQDGKNAVASDDSQHD